MENFGEIIRRFNLARARPKAKEGLDPDLTWNQYETPIDLYEKRFARLLPSITSHLLDLRRTKPTYVLDVLSAGRAIRDLAEADCITGGLSLTLNDWRNPEIKEYDKKLNIGIIEGNILYGQTIRKIKDWIKNQNSQDPTFDLIMCNPGLAFHTLKIYPYTWGLFEYLFWKAITLLHKSGGMLITDTPRFISGDELKVLTWIKNINKSGIGLDLVCKTPFGYSSGEWVIKATRTDEANPNFDPSKPSHYKKLSRAA